MNTVPYSDEFEKALIVGLLSDPSIIPRITAILDDEDFFKERNKEIYHVIRELDIDQVDSLTVQDKLSEDTREYFSDLIKSTDQLLPSLTNILVYAETIKDKAKLRAGIDLGRDIAALCFDATNPASETLARLEDMFARFLQKRVLENKAVSTQEAFKEFISTMADRLTEEGIKSGFMDLDMVTHGLEGLTVLAARPSVGKTALAINIARNVAEAKPVLFFSLEQPRKAIFERMLASESRVDHDEIRTAAYLADEESVKRVYEATERLTPIMDNLMIDDRPGVDTAYITSVARQKKFEAGQLGLMVVDYLHIMTLNPKLSKVDGLGEAVRIIRDIGRELGCPVILISQLKRPEESGGFAGGERRHRRPELTDLRSSGDIEQSADTVWMLHRESYYSLEMVPPEDTVEVLIPKNRNGRVGIVELRWIPRFVKFEDLG